MLRLMTKPAMPLALTANDCRGHARVLAQVEVRPADRKHRTARVATDIVLVRSKRKIGDSDEAGTEGPKKEVTQTLHVCHICLHWGGLGGSM